MKRKLFIIFLLINITLLNFIGCTKVSDETPVSKQGFYFDTIITITLYGKDKDSILSDCFKIADKYDTEFSTTKTNGDIYRINHSNGLPVTVADDTIELLNKGIWYTKMSHGVFNITLGQLSNLWNFDDQTKTTIPTDTQIQEALSTIDIDAISIQGNEVTMKNPNTQIDLGGIAKGYIADKMKEYLLKKHITSGIINLGGNVLTIGKKMDNTSYSVGIQKPFAEDGTPIATLQIADSSVVTSGTYQRYYRINHELYHHLLDLSTGYPMNNDLSSVTIVNASSVDGDALSTICFLYGLNKGKAYIESLDHTEAIFVTTDNKVYYTSGLKDKITIVNGN